jgi:hypothetical protein
VTADSRAVLALQVLEGYLITIDHDARVTPRHARRIDPDLEARITPDEILAGISGI